MRSFARHIFAVVLALHATAASPALAQARSGAGAIIQRLYGILDQLHLSVDQTSKIDLILHERRDAMALMRSNLESESPPERLQALREFTKTLHDKIDAELTPGQIKTFDPQFDELMKPKPRAVAVASTQPTVAKLARPSPRFEKLKTALDKMKLPPAQKKEIDSAMNDARPAFAAAAAASPQDRREKMTAALRALQGRLAATLTPAQQKSLREAMADNRNVPTVANKGTAKMGDNAMQDGVRSGSAAAVSAKPAVAAGYAVGQVPLDVKLDRLDQSPLALSAYKGRVVVMVFGSYSCPFFRDNAAALNTLGKQLGPDAVTLLVYTRESNPIDGWKLQRNEHDNVSIKQTTSVIQRRAAAQSAKQTLGLTVPIVVDDPSDSLATAFGQLPNGFVVLNRGGAVSAKFHWFDYTSARHAAAATEATPFVMSTPATAGDLR